MGLFDNFDIGKILTDTIPGLITGGLTTAATLYAPEREQAYADTQAGFEAAQQLAREKLAQDLEIARMQMAGAGAGASSALAAARINAKVNLAALREKAMADSISSLLTKETLDAQTLGRANEQRVASAQNVGASGLSGYGRAAQILQGFRA